MNKDLFTLWKTTNTKLNNEDAYLKNFNLNFGPQHPASHGVLRLILQLKNELIERADTHIGLLHRGTEKLIENKSYLKNLPYFDRMDYIAVLTQEHVYCLAIENLLQTKNYKLPFTQIRIIFDELTRIMNHLFAIATHALDIGCMAPVFWGFEEREKIMELYERVSGARMHVAFYRPNDLSINYITHDLIFDILLFLKSFFKRATMIENKLLMTSIWKYRLTNIGIFSQEFAIKWGVSGVLARSVGLNRDIRLNLFESYAGYYFLNIRSFLGYSGDCYDRYLIRLREMTESSHIILQIIQNLNILDYEDDLPRIPKVEEEEEDEDEDDFFDFFDQNLTDTVKPFKRSDQLSWYTSMEELINHFKYFSGGILPPKGHTYAQVESPKGEYGISLISDGSNTPYKCKIRTPSYYHLQLMDTMIQGSFVSDLITIIGSQDLVMGEVDK